MNICFVAARFPYPITKGDTLRAYYQIRELSRAHEIHLVSIAERAVAPQAIAEMRRHCASVTIVPQSRYASLAAVATRGLFTRTPLQVLYFDSMRLRAAVTRVIAAHDFDILHAMTIRVAPAVLDGRAIPAVVDFMDSFAANLTTRRDLAKPMTRPVYALELSRVSAYERRVAQRAAGGVVIAELDRSAIGAPTLDIVPNGVDLDALGFYDGPRDPRTLVFTGNMGYGPNVDAVTWFAASSWPILRARYPDLRWLIVGARPSPAVAALGRLPGIEVTGPVDHMAPFLQRATVSVCPIRAGSGMQNKILEAMAAGAPVVTTAFANRSIGAIEGREVSVGNDAESLAAAVAELIDDPGAARAQATAGRYLVESQFSWRRRADQLVQTYEAAIARRRASAA